MKPKARTINNKQYFYREISIGTLIYIVILGILNDYTNIVDAKSFSTIIFSGFVLELMTFYTLGLKKSAGKWHSNSKYKNSKFLKIFIVWLILFLSKFVFIFVLDLLFGSNLDISGFFGILIIAACATIAQQLRNN